MAVRPRDDVARSFFLIVVLSALLAGSLYILRPFLPGLIWAGTIVVATWPLLLWLQRRLGNRRWLAVLILMACLVVGMVLPLYLTIDTFAERADDITAAIRKLPTYTLFPPPSWVIDVPLIGPRAMTEWQRLSDVGPGGLLARAEPYLTMAARWLLGHAGVLGAFAIHMVITLVFAGILYVRGEVAARFISNGAARLAGPAGEVAVTLAGQAIRAVAMGIVLTAATQTALGGLGLWVADVPVAGILTAIMLLLCIAQIGPLLPMLAGVIFLYRADANITATVLLLWAIVIGTLDNVMRPWLISRGVRIPLLLILCGVIGGMLAFGLVGLFIGPVVLAVTQAMLRAWVQGTALVAEASDAADASAGESPDLSGLPGSPQSPRSRHSPVASDDKAST
ncbi:AI-2E family transporter YdiK [Bordetella sp. LUAb4]|uniref:AI-2E family transporter YdiK n=1 Tax=Bordetella sp. LUAb4 TaxID=2843195 RepID=UPI001E49C094|nr:AI-2E family transporter YdiK [Bordetella sp. LUAb4]